MALEINLRQKLGKNLSELLKKHNLKKEELSLILGFDNSYISKLIKGKINITIDKIEKIANFFKIEPYKLFKD